MPPKKYLQKRLEEMHTHHLIEGWISMDGKYLYTTKPSKSSNTFYITKSDLIDYLS